MIFKHILKPGLAGFFCLSTLAFSIFACEKEPGVKPSPCGGDIVQRALTTRWETKVAGLDYFAKRPPMVLGDKVLVIAGVDKPRTLYGLSAADGRVLYEAPVRGVEFSRLGNRLYASEGREIWETNLENGESGTLARFEHPLLDRVATTNGYVLCLEIADQPGDSTLYRYHAVNISNGSKSELYNYRLPDREDAANDVRVFDELAGGTAVDGAPLLVLTHRTAPGGGRRMVIKNLSSGTMISKDFPVPASPGSAGKLYVEAGKIYFAYGPAVYGLDAATGNELWSINLTDSGSNFALADMGKYLIANTPTGFSSRKQYLIDKTDGSIDLEKESPPGWQFSPNFFRGDQVFFTGDGALVAWNLKTGCLLNQQPLANGAYVAGGPVLSADGKTMFVQTYTTVIATALPE